MGKTLNLSLISQCFVRFALQKEVSKQSALRIPCQKSLEVARSRAAMGILVPAMLPSPSSPGAGDDPRGTKTRLCSLALPYLTPAFCSVWISWGWSDQYLQRRGKVLLAALLLPGRASLGEILKAFVSRSCQNPHLSQALKRPGEKIYASGIIIFNS